MLDVHFNLTSNNTFPFLFLFFFLLLLHLFHSFQLRNQLELIESEKRPSPPSSPPPSSSNLPPVILGSIDDLDGVNKGHQNGRPSIGETNEDGRDNENLDNWEAQISEIINWVSVDDGQYNPGF